MSLNGYEGEVMKDFYGREVPKHAHGTDNLGEYTCSTSMIREAVERLFDRCVDSKLFVRRITIDVNNVKREEDLASSGEMRQLTLFDEKPKGDLEKEKRANEAILKIKRRYGKNAILKGLNFEEGATGRERNMQIGGHRG